MAFNAKMMGNALANKMRGITENTQNQIQNPANTPAPATFDVPIATIGDAKEGDELAVRVVSIAGDMATLEKVEPGTSDTEVPPATETPPLG